MTPSTGTNERPLWQRHIGSLPGGLWLSSTSFLHHSQPIANIVTTRETLIGLYPGSPDEMSTSNQMRCWARLMYQRTKVSRCISGKPL